MLVHKLQGFFKILLIDEIMNVIRGSVDKRHVHLFAKLGECARQVLIHQVKFTFVILIKGGTVYQGNLA